MMGGGFGMVFMGLVPLLLIGLVVWAVLESSRRRDDHPPGVQYPLLPAPPSSSTTTAPPTARALLDERYARGDIGRDEYLQRRGDLG